MSVNKIEEYWHMYARENELNISVPDAWVFGDGSKEMRDELRSLVVKGTQTGTYVAYCVYGLEGEEIQKFGQYDIVLAGDNTRLAIIKYTEIDFLKMNEVTSDFSRSEYSERFEFSTWELSPYGLTFAPDLLLIYQTFRVMDVYRDRV
ncbi:ASCH domain-containing protein [Bacillus sp. AY18-3]|uniref:ASCH domain-containing protein n=1 Tax=Bacillus sp. AY18-3 TaxID=2217814 RepID=UPI0015D3C925|nr:ASCH domain-containing protein [Bacillus sp. AY18-3]